MARTSVWLAALALGLSAVGPARAQSAQEIEEARGLFSEGLSQEAAGDWAGALEKMEKVARVKLTAQVRYHIARCKEHLGRHTEALGDYRLAEYEAQKISAPELDEISRARADLEERVPKLVVVLPEAATGATVALDGVEMGAAQVGTEIPVNPGRHQLVAKLGKKEWRKRFTAREGKASRVKLVRRHSDDAAPEDETGPAPQEETPTADAGTKGAGPLPWVAAGVGVAGFVGAGVFYAQHKSAESDLDATCRGSVCPESMRDTQARSKRAGTLTGVCLAVGVVGAGTAAVLWLTQGSAPTRETAGKRIKLDAKLSPTWRGVAVEGAF